MVKSMTGFGKATAEVNGKKLIVEVKSLNSKQLDVSVRLPHLYREQELEIRNRIKAVAVRGKVDMFIYFEMSQDGRNAEVNAAAVGKYVARLKEVAAQLNLDVDDSSILKTVMRFPDTLQTEIENSDEQEIAVLVETVDRALERLDTYRIAEGEVLIADILNRVQLIENYAAEIPQFEEARVAHVREKIKEHLGSLVSSENIDTNRLEQELIYYIEKLDITEEKVRLANHCAYFRETAACDESGRKLGFIAQEMGREINTTGSKANNSDIQRIVVNMKDELEKIKEQSLNLL